MLSVCEGEEVFFDSLDESKELEEEEEEYDWMMCRKTEYDIWLSEPQSVNKRREMFLSGMGFVESDDDDELETSTESIDALALALLSERRESNSEANSSCWGADENIPNREKKKKKKKKKKSWWRRKINNFLWKKLLLDCDELSGRKCRAGQQVKAHNGLIRVIKFSPDGQYLASGGADGVVCVWRVVVVVGPGKVLHIEEEPLHKFRGHSSDVLDLAWSTTNHLLSSSMDTTVSLWQAGSDECLGVFHHSNYVTCVEFNPVDESYFISGSIDGKVRIWGIEKRRVKDWANVGDIVTTVCYQPDGKGFVVGSVSGHCRLYQISDDELLLNADINIQGKRKSSGNRITGIQFLKNDSRRVMITSEDSKIRVLDGFQEVVCKYKGLTKSGSQMSASFTSSGRHIVSVGEDSCIYLWNYEDPISNIQLTSKQAAKSTSPCETFFSAGVSVAIPWSDPDMGNARCNDHRHRDDSSRILQGSERFSLANWFSMEHGSSRASTTWPEEKLPVSDFPSAVHDCQLCSNAVACGDHKYKRIASPTWGLVFVTANWDGTIRTFHNYGLPSRI